MCCTIHDIDAYIHIFMVFTPQGVQIKLVFKYISWLLLSTYHEIYTKKKPNFMHVLSEGLEHTVQTPKMAYFFTYGSIIAEEQFRCKVRLFWLSFLNITVNPRKELPYSRHYRLLLQFKKRFFGLHITTLKAHKNAILAWNYRGAATNWERLIVARAW